MRGVSIVGALVLKGNRQERPCASQRGVTAVEYALVLAILLIPMLVAVKFAEKAAATRVNESNKAYSTINLADPSSP